ncbi:MAG: NAD(P)H-hydrate dehydratase [Phycisphaeraceae bacterium]|nr:NAD(P)H-hydrate dehydratase [Phycisphaeraceae bacterium]
MTAPLGLPPLPKRDPAGHKGTFGTVAVVGGCSAGASRMSGAPALAAAAALRAGAGLVRLFVPAPILDAAITICPAATGQAIPTDAAGAVEPHEAAAAIDRAASAADVLAVGPGLGVGPGPAALSLRAVQQHDVPVVIDADALNNLAEIPELTRDFHAAAVLTPHPGEYRRLADALNINADPADPAARPAAAEALAQRLGCIVVLKGAGSIITDGQRTIVNATGSAALATAGTGDVLTGLIAALVAQFVAPPAAHPALRKANPTKPLDLFQAAAWGVHLHGLAADLWVQARGASTGLLATELADFIPRALEHAHT